MRQYFECADDSLLTPEAAEALHKPSDYFTEIYSGVLGAAKHFHVPLSDATRERLFRVICWSQFADDLLDGRSHTALRHEVYEDAIAALKPEGWKPNPTFVEQAAPAYHWAEITRSACNEGDMSDHRREAMHR